MEIDPGTLRSRWTDVGGLRMHALVSTEPAPAGARAVVLVHGSGLSGRYMIPTARELTADFRVYVPDFPGFGDSDKPDKMLTVPGLADALAAWLPAAGLERASLLGNSFGCQVIADLAARHPQRVERAILQGPTTPPEERSWFWQYRSFQEQLTDRSRTRQRASRHPCWWCGASTIPSRISAGASRSRAYARLAIIPGVAHTLCYTAPVQLAQVTRAFVNES